MEKRRNREKWETARNGMTSAQWRHSNLVILEMFKKENYLGEAYVRTRWRKASYRRERDSLEGPCEKAEIQRKALRQGKNLAFSKDTCLEKERVQSKVTPRKVGVGLKRRQELSKEEVGLEVSLLGINWEGGLTFAQIERNPLVLGSVL